MDYPILPITIPLSPLRNSVTVPPVFIPEPRSCYIQPKARPDLKPPVELPPVYDIEGPFIVETITKLTYSPDILLLLYTPTGLRKPLANPKLVIRLEKGSSMHGYLISIATLQIGAPKMLAALHKQIVPADKLIFRFAFLDAEEAGKKVSAYPVRVLPEDHGLEAKTILDILHYRHSNIATSVTLEQLVDIAETCAKYECTEMILPWVDGWVDGIKTVRKGVLRSDVQEWATLWLALKRQEKLEEMVKTLTKLVGAKSECGYYFSVFCEASMIFPQMMLVEDFPREMVEYIETTRLATTVKLVNLIRAFFTDLSCKAADSKFKGCKQYKCIQLALGSFTHSLMDENLWPLISDPPATWYSSMGNLAKSIGRLEIETGHDSQVVKPGTLADKVARINLRSPKKRCGSENAEMKLLTSSDDCNQKEVHLSAGDTSSEARERRDCAATRAIGEACSVRRGFEELSGKVGGILKDIDGKFAVEVERRKDTN